MCSWGANDDGCGPLQLRMRKRKVDFAEDIWELSQTLSKDEILQYVSSTLVCLAKAQRNTASRKGEMGGEDPHGSSLVTLAWVLSNEREEESGWKHRTLRPASMSRK